MTAGKHENVPSRRHLGIDATNKVQNGISYHLKVVHSITREQILYIALKEPHHFLSSSLVVMSGLFWYLPNIPIVNAMLSLIQI